MTRSLFGSVDLPGLGVGAGGSANAPLPADVVDEIGPLVGSLRASGYGGAVDKILALYRQPAWTPSGLSPSQKIGAFFDAAVATNAPWEVIDRIDDAMPPDSRPLSRGLLPHPALDQRAGRTAGWNRRRFNRTVALLLLAPGNPDGRPRVRADRAVYLTMAGQQANPRDTREAYATIVPHARHVASDLEARGLTWTARMIHHAMRVVDADPDHALTPGNAAYQSARAVEAAFREAGNAASTGLRTGLAWGVPLAVVLGVGYIAVRRLR